VTGASGHILGAVAMIKDYYWILGVNQVVTPAEIKLAFRQLARTYRPDVSPADPQAARKVQEIISEEHSIECSLFFTSF